MTVFNMVAAFALLALYLGFGAITNATEISQLIEEYIAEEHPNDSEKVKNYFRWMSSFLWIVFWPIFIAWGLINDLIDLDE